MSRNRCFCSNCRLSDPSLLRVGMSSLSKEKVKKGIDNGEYHTTGKPPLATATWWSNFQRVQDQDENFIPYVQCVHCRQVLAYDSRSTGTRSISYHARSCKKPSGTNQDIARMFRNNSSVPSETKKSFIDACVKFCSTDMRPFEIVKGEGFANLCQTLLDIGRRSATPIESTELIPDPTTVSRRTQVLAEGKISSLSFSGC